MTYTETLELVESIQLLHEIFDDNEKVAKWLITGNPIIGAPIDVFFMGRGHKVLQFIRSAQRENFK